MHRDRPHVPHFGSLCCPRPATETSPIVDYTEPIHFLQHVVRIVTTLARCTRVIFNGHVVVILLRQSFMNVGVPMSMHVARTGAFLESKGTTTSRVPISSLLITRGSIFHRRAVRFILAQIRGKQNRNGEDWNCQVTDIHFGRG